MASPADIWLPSGRDARRVRRVLAALGVSLLCHALVVLVAPDWRGAARPAPPLLVTMLERGRGDDDAGAGPAAPPSAPAVAAPAPAPPVVAVRAEPRPRHPLPTAPRPAAAPAGAAIPALPAPGADAAVAGAGTSSGASTAGAGNGGGRGASDGSGSDGLRAFCARCPAPDYPSRARRQGWQGTVDVALAIAGDGAVADARVERSSGYPALDEVALDVARQSRFAIPAGGAGLRGQLRYRFVLDATAARR